MIFIYRNLLTIIQETGAILLFFKKIVRVLFFKKMKYRDVFEQIWHITIESAPTTAMAGFFVGSILTVQFTMQLKEFDALSYLGGLATSGTLREIGPLLIAFLLSGKIGAYTSAELGTMRVTEQIDAVRCLGADPLQEIILPRFIGIVVSSFFLLAAGLMMSILGGMLLGHFFADVNYQEYLRHVPDIVAFPSIVSGLFKCLVFSFVLALICTYFGFHATGGAKGVGRAVVSTAVVSMVTIVVMDWFTSYLGEKIMQLVLGY